MRPSPVSSFTKSLVGFSVFIGVSFGITFWVNMISIQESKDEQTAAAAARMLEQVK
jgi:hypothetical protein